MNAIKIDWLAERQRISLHQEISSVRNQSTMEEGMPVTFDPEFHDRDSVCRMEYVDLGKTGLKVSKISLGSGQFSKLYG